MQEDIKRNLAIVKDKETGNNGKPMTYRELEAKYGISQSTITRIIYRYRIKEKLAKLEKPA